MRVVRFRSDAGRDPSFHPLSAALLADPGRASMEDAERWLDLQGPVTADLADAAAVGTADVVVFYPYLYYPTVRVIDRVPVPTILHPAAHDEPALHLPVFPRVFDAADALVFQTDAERHLVERTFPVASHHQLLLGPGCRRPRRRGADPGRVDRVSRSPVTASVDPPVPGVPRAGSTGTRDTTCWPQLFAGTRSGTPGHCGWCSPARWWRPHRHHPDIDVLGTGVRARQMVPPDQGATALVSPSAWEAFSLVVAEAWSARTPVLVNAACAATVEHCRRSGGGSGIRRVRRVRGCRRPARRATPMPQPDWASGAGPTSTRWFRWPRVIDRYASFVESVAARGRAERASSGSASEPRPERA